MQESGYKIRSYEDYVRSIPVMYHLYSIVGKAATNVIVSMSGSLPPYFAHMAACEQSFPVARPVIGSRPEYNDIMTIDSLRYGELSRIPDSALATVDFWKLRKFEYIQIFSLIDEKLKEMH